MSRQWNFIIENKLITVYSKDLKRAKAEAQKIFDSLKRKRA
ncbi:hypothetical protein [Edaphobacillus lindanitolerans]|uniref:Uncharacterized protein n=1 Tax=Edaphobacillus lindanitolerans TaxID=550447 RepID=A0A1U7PSL6_9BACI|nr:hypothetical protein [Edaphobacillus lindanitolerans]SIT90666.1 hypothetical protein SAMN05428946_2496 [Edaphobacillus lindanitolerans]